MATLSSAEFRNQHRVVNELKDVAAVFARLRARLQPVAAAKGEFVGAMRWLAAGPGVPGPAAAGLYCKTCR